MTHLSELLASGALHPIVGSTHSLEGAVEALRELDERQAMRKVVLTLR